jgi:hypothetical protein
VNACGTALEFASDELRADREIVVKAIKQDPAAFAFAAPALKEDAELVLQVTAASKSHMSVLEAVFKHFGSKLMTDTTFIPTLLVRDRLVVMPLLLRRALYKTRSS